MSSSSRRHMAATATATSPTDDAPDFDVTQAPGGLSTSAGEGSAMFNEGIVPDDAFEEVNNLSRNVEGMSFLSASGGADRERLDDAEDIGYLPPTVEDPAEEGEGPDEAVAATAADSLPGTPRRTSRDGEAATLATAAGAASADGDAASDDQHENIREVPDWPLYDKHIFILSNAGKPIYTRHGNEDKLATIMGVMQALISFVEEENDQLRWFVAGKHRFVFFKRDPLLLVAVAKTGEPYPHLALQLSYLYNLIISVLTLKQLQKIFEQRPNFDLRRMLHGTEKAADSLVDMMDRNPSFFLSAVRCLRMPQPHRDKMAQILQAHRSEDLLFAVLIADNQLITLLRRKRYSLLPQDMLLIMNLVASSQAFKTAENWTPICLPKFNSDGFLHAHISYVDDNATTCLLLLSTNREAFYALSGARNSIVQSLASQGCLEHIASALRRRQESMSSLGIADLRHFLYKNKSSAQYTSPSIEPPYTLPGQEQRLLREYQAVHAHMHSAARPLKIYYKAGANETLLGWITSGFELFAAFNPLVTKTGAINAVLDLIRWMKKEESALFILSPQTF